MRSRSAALFPLGLMLFLAGGTYWLYNATQVAAPRSGKERHDPDFIIDAFSIRRFNAAGAVQQSLAADRMLHFPDDDSTEVIAPSVTYHREPPMHAVAQRAWLDKEGKHVHMAGDVRVWREAGGPHATDPVDMQTAWLDVVPDDETAHTDAPVTFIQNGTVIHGVGLDIDNKARVSTLRGRVRGVIEPKSPSVAPSRGH